MKRLAYCTPCFVAVMLLCGAASAWLWLRSWRVADWVTFQWASAPDVPYLHHRVSVLSERGWLTARLEVVSGGDARDAENEEWLRNLHRDVWSGLRVTEERADAPWVDVDEGVITSQLGGLPMTSVVRHRARVPWALAPTAFGCSGVFIAARWRRQRKRAGSSPRGFDIPQ